MRTRALRLIAALFAVALLAAACGNDDSTATTDTASADTASANTAMAGDTSDTDHDDHEHSDHSGQDPDADHDADPDINHDADPDADHGDEQAHDHGAPVEFAGTDVPTISIDVEADPAGGIDIHIDTTNFTVNPQAASTEHVEGEGHYHLWIDGEKVLRFYNDSIHYAGVVEGDVDVMVELSANDHRSYAVDGAMITDMVSFTVPAHDHGEHSHGDTEVLTFAGVAPVLTIEVEADPKSGYNAFITVEGMTLSAENASGDHVDGEGHLHLMVNGQKIGRLYGLATHIPVLPDGEVEISVTAFSNDHQAYVASDGPISAATTVVVES